jgi:cell division protein FtsL
MEEGGMRRGNGAIRMALACALLFGSLSLVVWRQSRALDELRALDAVRAERGALQAERAALQHEIQRLESRPRIVAVAGARLGLRVPTHTELMFLSAPAYAAGDGLPDGDPQPTAGRVPSVRRLLLTAAGQH